jgi:ectoine hydroxylase-related dioxygenase (phytanoyl-CoA dioxygenase family)
VRGALTPAQVEQLRADIAASLADEKQIVIDYDSDRKFVNGINFWTRNEGIRALLCESQLPALAAALMESRKVNLFYDQLFIKEPGTTNYPTPWHNDQPYWIVEGRQVISFWLALDPVTKASGAVEFIRGSHKWDRWFQPRSFAGENKYEINKDFESMPDIDAERAKYDIVHFDLAPGDMTVHHGMTVHGSSGNTTNATRRRGFSVRYTGDDVVYIPRKSFPFGGQDVLVPGKAMDSESFPVVYRADETPPRASTPSAVGARA